MTILQVDDNGETVDALTPGTVQNLTIGAASVASAAFSPNTMLLRIASDVDCWITVAPAPIASATNAMRVFSKFPEYIAITKGHKLAVLQVAGAGSLNITEAA